MSHFVTILGGEVMQDRSILTFYRRIADILDEALERDWGDAEIYGWERQALYAQLVVIGLGQGLNHGTVEATARAATDRYYSIIMGHLRKKRLHLIDEFAVPPAWADAGVAVNDNEVRDR
jgi:hypothetical protein